MNRAEWEKRISFLEGRCEDFRCVARLSSDELKEVDWMIEELEKLVVTER